MEKVLQSILKEITPTEEEHKKEKAIVEKIIKKLGKYDIEPVLVGSIAKKTDLRGDKDIDIFIMFHEKTERKTLEEKGLEIGKEIFNSLKAEYEIDYAEHPYVVGFYKNYNIEIVPCYKTKKIKSAVDRTPYHTKYVMKKIRQNRKLRDEILLLKQFMKAIGTYGAESKIQGFSGYLVELLIISYGSFNKVLKAAINWRFGEVIDPENLWDKKEGIDCLFPKADLVIIDPVDKYRNAAAAVSRQRIAELKVKAAEFLEQPDRKLFFPSRKKPPSITELKKAMDSRGTRFYTIQFTHPKINVNSLYSQLRKTTNSASSIIEKNGFRIMKTDFWTNEADKSIIIYEMEVWSLPATERRVGPPVDKSREDQDKFIKKHRKTYLEGGRWVADAERKITEAEELLNKIITERKGFGRHLRETAEIEILKDHKILETGDKDYLIFLKEFLAV